jgi:hypothetical protein
MFKSILALHSQLHHQQQWQEQPQQQQHTHNRRIGFSTTFLATTKFFCVWVGHLSNINNNNSNNNNVYHNYKFLCHPIAATIFLSLRMTPFLQQHYQQKQEVTRIRNVFEMDSATFATTTTAEFLWVLFRPFILTRAKIFSIIWLEASNDAKPAKKQTNRDVSLVRPFPTRKHIQS